MKMPKQTAPIARDLNTTVQAGDQNGVEASINWGHLWDKAVTVGKAVANAL